MNLKDIKKENATERKRYRER